MHWPYLMDQYLFNGESYQKKSVSMLLNYVFLQEGRTLTAMALQKGLCTARPSNDEELSSVLLLIKGNYLLLNKNISNRLTAKRRLERLQFSTSSLFVKI